MKKTRHILQVVKETISKNFKSATITFITIMLVVSAFQMLFGPQNMVLGIMIAPMMLILMSKDMTAHPVKHFSRQALVLCGMATAACISMVVPITVALFIHLIVVFFISYTYTCDCGDHMYFQYILDYLFLIFMGPISLQQLPLRLLGMVTGAGLLLLYQFIKGRHRADKVTQNVLLSLLEDTKIRINSLLSENKISLDNISLDNALKTFSLTIEHRQKATLGLSEASMAAIETVHSLKKFNSALRFPNSAYTQETLSLLQNILPWLDDISSFILHERDDIPQIHKEIFDEKYPDTEQLYQWTEHLRLAFLTMLLPEKRQSFRKTSVSLKSRLKIAINFSPMRVAYAFRLSILLSVGIILVQAFHLEHGKWLLFTIASVSLPYSDEVGTKAKKRFLATLIGGTVGLVLYSVIPSAAGKTIVMLASGYLSCYMTDYLSNFSCATFGALGGAVFSMTSTGFAPVGSIVLIRLAYIVIGIIIAVAFNCFVFPVSKTTATRHLAQKYIHVTQAISNSYTNYNSDPQLHYLLLLKMQRLEGKLKQNAKALQWEGIHSFLRECQMNIWKAISPHTTT